MSFNIGDKVAARYNLNYQGTIIGVSQIYAGSYVVEFPPYGSCQCLVENELVSSEELAKLIAEKKAKESELEAAFQSTRVLIASKIEAADALLKEANELAADAGKSLYSFTEMDSLLSDNNLQWYSSSSAC